MCNGFAHRLAGIPSSSLRALLVTNMWPTPERPESGIFVADQAEALRRAGVDVDVFAFPGGSVGSYIKAAARLSRKRRTRYDVVHAHFGLSAWVALAAKAKLRAVTFHGTDLANPRSRKLSLAALRFIDLPAAVSADLAKSIPADRAGLPVRVLPCGVAVDRFRPKDRNEARQQLGLELNQPIILLPSDPARPEKRADRARQLADAVGAHLVNLGAVAPTTVAAWINASDLVVIPSEREGFGLALLEALACNRPVISTPNGIAPEVLDGLPGTLCADWDLELWTQTAQALINSAVPVESRARVNPFSADRCAAAVILAWQQALAAK